MNAYPCFVDRSCECPSLGRSAATRHGARRMESSTTSAAAFFFAVSSVLFFRVAMAVWELVSCPVSPCMAIVGSSRTGARS